jgi:ubiquinone/menaquinone biosynthesis C-methylase UbiE
MPGASIHPGPVEADRLAAYLGGEQGSDLVDFMVRKLFGGAEKASDPQVRALAAELGWIDPETGSFTQNGWFAADSCREYRFWEERGGRLPFEDADHGPQREEFAGRAVLEVGCGMGANLMSLHGTAGALLGVEPVETYRQLGAALREKEGRGGIEVRDGSGEAIPAPDASQDIVLLVSAHQYMEIGAALREMARVLRPGGELIVIGGTIDSFGGVAKGLRLALGGSLPEAKEHLRTVVNTLGYMAFERRILVRKSAWSTAHPVYPRAGFMVRKLVDAGLKPVGSPLPIPPETCFRARKPLAA